MDLFLRRLLYLLLFPRGVVCLWSPFHLYRTEIVTSEVVGILEPATSRTKRTIVDTLLANSPERLKAEILAAESDWK
jgi:hypothetical protein